MQVFSVDFTAAATTACNSGEGYRLESDSLALNTGFSVYQLRDPEQDA